MHIHPFLPRRISVAEALAIQSLPANFVIPNDFSLSDAFKTIGNGVPYLLSRGIAEAINDYFNDINVTKSIIQWFHVLVVFYLCKCQSKFFSILKKY